MIHSSLAMMTVDAHSRERRRTPRCWGPCVQHPQERRQHHDPAPRIHRTRWRLRHPLHPQRRQAATFGGPRPRRRDFGSPVGPQPRPHAQIGPDRGEAGRNPGTPSTPVRRRLRACPPARQCRPIPHEQRLPTRRRLNQVRYCLRRDQHLAARPAQQHRRNHPQPAALDAPQRRGAPARRRESHGRPAGPRRRQPIGERS